MIKRCKNLLGTFVEIKVLKESPDAYLAVEEAFKEISEIHNLMSFFNPDSQVTALNCQAYQKRISIDKRLYEVLLEAQKIYRASKGLFDVTLHHGQKSGGNFSDIELFGDLSVIFHKPTKIDLGGIAKGYAVDCAAKIIESYNIKDYIINAGGDLRVGDIAQKISIRNPKNLGDQICEIDLKNSSLATSAGYFSHQEVGLNGLLERIYPIYQSAQKPMQYCDESFSVISENCMRADALAKIVAIAKERSIDVLKQFGARAIFVMSSGQVKFINQ